MLVSATAVVSFLRHHRGGTIDHFAHHNGRERRSDEAHSGRWARPGFGPDTGLGARRIRSGRATSRVPPFRSFSPLLRPGQEATWKVYVAAGGRRMWL